VFFPILQRTWNGIERSENGGIARKRSPLPRHAKAPAGVPKSDPNNEVDKSALLEWIAYSDFYQFPHVQQFSTIDELMVMLGQALDDKSSSMNLTAISLSMREYNLKQREYVEGVWGDILVNIKQNRNSTLQNEHIAADINSILFTEYNLKLDDGCFGSIFS
jgi:hypothetical protein